jgi:signal transduction histidine kinase
VAEVQLVCILQEALTNVRKHSGAAHVKALLSREVFQDDEFITLRITDDGVGFDSAASRRSFGLLTMRERAASVNGELVVSSSPGRGTQVECRLPCLERERLHRRSVVLQ